MNNYFDTVAHNWDDNPLKVERAEVTAKKIKQFNFRSTNSFVDFGSGTGLLGVQLLDTFSHIVLADASQQMLNIANAKIADNNLNNIKTNQVERLSDIQSKQSAIATLMTLHHIQNVQQFFLDAYDILEECGILIIADLYAEDGSFHQHNPSFDGHNGFDVTSLSNIATESGFKVISIEKYYDVWHENFEGENRAYPLFFFIAAKEF